MNWTEISAAILAALNLGVVWYYSARLERLTKESQRSQTAWNVGVELAPLAFLDVQLARVERLVEVIKSGSQLADWGHEVVALDAAVREVLSRASVARSATKSIARLSDAVRYVRESVGTSTLVPACEQFQQFASESRSAIGDRVKELEALRSSATSKAQTA